MTSVAPAAADWTALGTLVRLVVTDPAALPEARRLLEEDLAALDLACSRFRPDSELRSLDGRAGRPVPVSPLLADAIAVALQAARRTAGDVDPTVGSAMSATRLRPRLLGGAGDRATAAGGPGPAPGWETVRLDRAAGTVAVPRRCPARPRRHRQGVRRRPLRRPDPRRGSAPACWSASAATLRSAGARAGRRLADPGAGRHRPPSGTCGRPGVAHRPARRGPGHLEHDCAPLGAWRRRSCTTSSTPGAGCRPSSPWRTVSVAAADLRDGEHHQHRGRRPGRPRRRPGSRASALAARLVDQRRRRQARRWLADGLRGGGVMNALWVLSRATGMVSLVLLTSSWSSGSWCSGSAGWEPCRASWWRGCIATRRCWPSPCSPCTWRPWSTTLTSASGGSTRWCRSSAATGRSGWGSARWRSTWCVALVATSLLRHRMPARAWRAVHWTAYACWPVALAHGIGTGTDLRATPGLLLAGACTAAVAAAAGWRWLAPRPAAAPLRASALIRELRSAPSTRLRAGSSGR